MRILVCNCIYLSLIKSSVADPGFFIPDPDFYPFRIPATKQQQKRGVKKICCQTFFCSHKFHKIANYFIFLNAEEKKFGPVFKEL